MNNYLPIIILAILSFGLLLFILLRKKEPGLPSSLINNSNGKNNTLELSKLVQSTSFNTSEGGEITISDKPMYLPNGLYIHIDKNLVNITSEHIEKAHLDTDSDTPVMAYSQVLGMLKDLDTNTSDLHSKSQKLLTSINHYVELIVNFLASNPNANPNWRTLLTTLGDIKQILTKLTTPKISKDVTDEVIVEFKAAVKKLDNLKITSMEEIYDSLKFTITKLGGFSKLLHRFQRRIKWDMIQAIVNNDDNYRTVSKESKVEGSKHCTAYPLKWWQNCPDNTRPVGSQGWSKTGACNKWYQHISGELMCAPYTSNFKYPVGGNCDAIINAVTTVKDGWHKDKNSPVVQVISRSLSSILSSLSLSPSLHAVIRTISTIFRLAMPALEGDYSWLIEDLADVCYNYKCEGNTKTNVCNGDTAKPYCVPKMTDNQIANRDCAKPNSGCFTEPSGCCINDNNSNLCPSETKTTYNVTASSASRSSELLDYSILI